MIRRRFSAAERRAGIEYARQWRIANKPYFDAIYGPETTRHRCASCAGRGYSEVAQ